MGIVLIVGVALLCLLIVSHNKQEDVDELAEDGPLQEVLEEATMDIEPEFGYYCKELEENTLLRGIRIIINYYYNNKLLLKKTCTSADAKEDY